MKTRFAFWPVAVTALGAALLLAATPAFAQIATPSPDLPARVPDLDDEAPVFEHDLSGPRFGGTFGPHGSATSQFGWHTEHAASPGRRGPWLIVETVLLVSGLEQNAIVPSASLVFGVRAPGGLELGVGPSVTIGGAEAVQSGIVLAAGYSFRLGSIRIPMNLAWVPRRDGDYRVSFVTGWAIRDRAREAR